MAKNKFGFIHKRYKQPDYEREVFGECRAYYKAGNGKLFMVVACPRTVGRWGDDIHHYEILKQEEDCCRMIGGFIKSQKKAMEMIENLLNNNQN